MTKNIQNIILLCLISVLLISCKSSNGKETGRSVSGEQIAYVYLKFRDKDGEISARPESIELVPGKLKPAHISENKYFPGCFSCSFLDKEKKVLQTLIFEDPFVTRFESVDSENNLKSDYSRSKEGKITLRVQYNVDFYYISIDRIDNKLNSQNIYLKRMKIGEYNDGD